MAGESRDHGLKADKFGHDSGEDGRTEEWADGGAPTRNSPGLGSPVRPSLEGTLPTRCAQKT